MKKFKTLDFVPFMPKGFICHFDDSSGFASLNIIAKLPNGTAYARLYWYENEYPVLDSLSVDPDIRQLGQGRLLQVVRENVAKFLLEAEECWLWVKKDSWMYEWYKRRGYVDVKPHEQMEGCIWMFKKLEQ